MVRAYIGLGSNIGDGLHTLTLAWRELGRIPQLRTVLLSSPYLSKPIGMESENWFCNAAGAVETSLSGQELLAVLQKVEKDFGRVRKAGSIGYQDRTLDLDILLFGDTISHDPLLTLPHPEMVNRRFVLEPLAEIASDTVHPVCGLTVSEMNKQLAMPEREERQKIKKLAWPEP